MRRRAGRSVVASVFAGIALGATPSAQAEEATVGACTVRLVNVDPNNVPTFRGECLFALAPAWVTAALTDARPSSSMLKSSDRLPDGRVVNVQKTGWPFEDRQSTIVIDDEPLPDGGVRRRYRLAGQQAPLAEGTVQVAVDQGTWEVTAHPTGTRVVLEMRYEPGGNLPTRIVQTMSPKYIAKGMDELRISAERLAREAASVPGVAAGPPRR